MPLTLISNICRKVEGEKRESSGCSANFCIDSQPTFNKPVIVELESNLPKLQDLDSIGMRQEDKVHESVLDNVSFTGIRYSVGLPRKAFVVGFPCATILE